MSMMNKSPEGDFPCKGDFQFKDIMESVKEESEEPMETVRGVMIIVKTLREKVLKQAWISIMESSAIYSVCSTLKIE